MKSHWTQCLFNDWLKSLRIKGGIRWLFGVFHEIRPESVLVDLNPSHIPIYGGSDPPSKVRCLADAHLTDQLGQPMWNPPIQVVLTQALALKGRTKIHYHTWSSINHVGIEEGGRGLLQIFTTIQIMGPCTNDIDSFEGILNPSSWTTYADTFAK